MEETKAILEESVKTIFEAPSPVTRRFGKHKQKAWQSIIKADTAREVPPADYKKGDSEALKKAQSTTWKAFKELTPEEQELFMQWFNKQRGK